MVPCALVALNLNGWKWERDVRSMLLGGVIGLTGAGGQLVLFEALKQGPAYIVFPVISLSPVVTIVLSTSLLKERAAKPQWFGIALALASLLLLSYAKPDQSPVRGYLWFLLAVGVFAAWGLQAFLIRLSSSRMSAESIFFYMMISGVSLAPVALWMTDFRQPINWGFRGPYLAAMIHALNSIGALMLVYALRYGRAIIVTPMTNALAPVITIVLSLLIYGRIPPLPHAAGMVCTIIAIFLLTSERTERNPSAALTV